MWMQAGDPWDYIDMIEVVLRVFLKKRDGAEKEGR